MKYKTMRIKPFGILIEANSSKDDVCDLNVEELRKLFQNEHLITLRGFRTFEGAEDFSAFCESWGEISMWPFGKVLELVEHENPEDHIFDNNYVPLHWDGMYRLQVPEYQIFHCVQAPSQGCGGRTTFSNTAMAIKNASAKTMLLWEKVTGHYQRKMEFYNSKTVSPIITQHPFRNYPVIRYNEPSTDKNGRFINPASLLFTGIPEKELVEFHHSLLESLYSQHHFYAHEWHIGDVVISDNFTLLHGREAFLSKSPRHLRRVHVLSNPPFDNPGLESYK